MSRLHLDGRHRGASGRLAIRPSPIRSLEALLFATGVSGLAACTAAEEPAAPAGGESAAEAPARTCATPEPTVDMLRDDEDRWGQIPDPNDLELPVRIDVHFHVIYSLAGEGEVDDDAIEAQMRVLDEAFAGTGFYFDLSSVTRTYRTSWFRMTPGSTAEAQAKATLRRGDSTDLNIYTIGPTSPSLGWSTFPAQLAEGPADDGVVLFYGSLPGGPGTPFDEGDTATHEIGHWLGLYHTFQGGCSKANDYVADTTAEASPGTGCPFDRDSCTGSLFEGRDPVENFMGFADDSCMVLFTEEQAVRMRAQWLLHRDPV